MNFTVFFIGNSEIILKSLDKVGTNIENLYSTISTEVIRQQ